MRATAASVFGAHSTNGTVGSARMSAADAPLNSSPAEEPINILIVDDEPKNLTVLESILNDPTYRLVRAESADQALLALLGDQFALLILDIRMPGVTGFELAHLIKERKKTAKVPIIFLTAYYNEDQHVIAGYDAGAVDYLHKPVNPFILRSKVAVFADLHRMQRELARTNGALLAEVAERRTAEQRLQELTATLEQRVAERTRALGESAALLQTVTDNAGVGLARIDSNGRYRFANPAYAESFGLSGSVTGEDAARLLGPVYSEQIEAQVARALAGERVASELSLPGRPGQQPRHFSVVYAPEHDAATLTGVVIAMFDITERKGAEERIRLLLSEINHRVKNSLSLVCAIARHTTARDPQDYLERFSARIQALAASHDLLARTEWQSIPLSALIRSQLAHFEDLIDTRITLKGDPLDLSTGAAQTLGMVLHELATNAAKHGALSDQRGQVEITWEIVPDPEADRFLISWTERNGPVIGSPADQGFGSTVIKPMAELSLNGTVNLSFAPSGFSWQLQCPAGNILRQEPGSRF